MSANRDVVRSIFAAYERGDYSSADWAHDAIQFEIVGGPSPVSVSGRAELARAWTDVFSVWTDVRAVADEIIELDSEHVLVLYHLGGQGKTSGLDLADVATGLALVYQLRSGEVTRLTLYMDRDRAFADLGLTPQGEKL